MSSPNYKKQASLLLVCLVLLSPTPAMAFGLNISIWDIIASMFSYETDDRTSLEKAIDLPEDSAKAVEHKLAKINKLLGAKGTTDYQVLSSALPRASEQSSVLIVRRLLEYGADVHSRDGAKFTALMRASENRDPLVAKLLIDAGADPNAKVQPRVGDLKIEEGDSALIIAAGNGNPDVVKMLLEHGAEVDYICKGRCVSALKRAIDYHDQELTRRLFSSTEAEMLDIGVRYTAVVRHLLEHGANANLITSSSSTTPLVLALSERGSAFVPMLLKHGAKVNVFSESEGTWPLVAAAYHRDASSVRLLLARGADVRAVNKQGQNALVAAVTGLSRSDVKLEIVELLLASGAPVNAKNGGLTTTLNEAINGARSTRTSAGSMFTPTSHIHEIQILLRLIELGADLDTVDKRGNTALDNARINHYQPVVEAIEQRIKSSEKSQIKTQPFIRTTVIQNVQADASMPQNKILLSPSRKVNVPAGIRSMAISPDGRFVALGGGTGIISLLSLTSGEPVFELKGHTSTVTTLAFSPDGQQLVSGSFDSSIKLWDVNLGREIRELFRHSWAVKGVVFHPDGKSIFSGSMDHTLRRWSVESGGTSMIYSDAANDMSNIAVSPNGQTVMINKGRGNISMWDVLSARRLYEYQVPGSGYLALFSPDGKSILADLDGGAFYSGGGLAPSGGGVVLFDAKSGQERFRHMRHSHRVKSFAFSPNGKHIASASYDGVMLYDTMDGSHFPLMRAHRGVITAVAFSPDNRTLLSGGGDDRTLMFWTLPQ